jgi:nucleotide-binding universal stress UspA family protein
MTIKKILVPLDGDHLNQAVLETALAGARRFQAHLEVLYVRPNPREMLPYATLGMSASMRRSVVDAAERSGAESAQQVRAAFEQFCRDNEVEIADKPPAPDMATAAWREETGHAGEALIRHGRLSDLIFVPRPAQGAATAETFETALLETGQPLVIVPPKAHTCIASRITIGWNGSAEVARAIAEAMVCLTSADAVIVLAARKRAASAGELLDYLGWHGVKAELKIFDVGSRSVGETLLEESHALGADLLVVGGYTHTRARQLLFGGVTSHVLTHADIPVLMAH